MKDIVFYTTQHCGLCEAAMDALLALPEAQGSRLRTIDVALDDHLMAAYGTRIPVWQWVKRSCKRPSIRAPCKSGYRGLHSSRPSSIEDRRAP